MGGADRMDAAAEFEDVMNPQEYYEMARSLGRWGGDGLRAEALQQSVISQEAKFAPDYTDQEVRMATVHTRQDIILLVSYLASINRRARSIQWLLWLVLSALVLVLVRIWPIPVFGP